MALIIKRAKSKSAARGRRHDRVRKKVHGTSLRPRLVVSRSSRHIFVQIVNDSLGQGLAQRVVHDLDEDMPARTRHHQTRTQRRAVDLLAHAVVTATTRGALALGALDDQCHGLLTSLSDLAADLLACVTNALAFVWVGLAQLANVCGDLANELLVDALDRKAGGVLNDEGDALWRLDGDRVAVAESELEVAPLDYHAVTGAVDLHLLLIALGDTENHVGDKGAGQAVQRTRLALIVGALDLDTSLN